MFSLRPIDPTPKAPALSATPGVATPTIVVVLGCRLHNGRPSAALSRRLERAAGLATPASRVVLSGGKSWDGVVEADAMAVWWRERSLPGELLRERRSRNTRENARFSGELLGAPERASVVLVTCDFHMARAQVEFRRVGITTEPAPAGSPGGSLQRWQRRLRELGARALSALLPLFVLTTSCQNSEPTSQAPLELPAPAALKLPPSAEENARLLGLAREPDAEAEEPLTRALLGGPEARRWGAFGLGRLCGDSPGQSSAESQLIVATPLWFLSEQLPSQTELIVLSQALGNCASPRAETALRAWLRGAPKGAELRLGRAAAYGLGNLVDRRGGLDDQTLSRLLEMAESTKSAALLYPLGRIARLSRAVSERTIEVAGKLLLADTPESRRDAIFALGSAGSPAASALSAVVESKRYRLNERTAATQALARLGEKGARELDRLTLTLLERGVPSRADDPEWIVLLATLNSLPKSDESSESLDLVRRGPLPTVTEESSREMNLLRAQRRRLIHLRCRAAELQAGAHFEHQHLQRCDPEGGPIGKAALLRVLDRVPLKPAASLELSRLLNDQQPAVVEMALAVAAAHREFPSIREAVLRYGNGPSERLRAASLKAVAAHPERFGGKDGPDSEVVAMLDRALNSGSSPSTLLMALEAAGAMGALDLKPSVEKLCAARGPAARALSEAATRALGLLGDPRHVCRAHSEWFVPTGPGRASRHILDSDLGEISLTLDGEVSPGAVERIRAALEAGVFAEAQIQSAREGFLVEWAPSTPLEPGVSAVGLERTAGEVRAGAVLFQPPEAPGAQMALLLALSDAPQLNGHKAIVGHFEGPVELLVPGDRLVPQRSAPR